MPDEIDVRDEVQYLRELVGKLLDELAEMRRASLVPCGPIVIPAPPVHVHPRRDWWWDDGGTGGVGRPTPLWCSSTIADSGDIQIWNTS